MVSRYLKRGLRLVLLGLGGVRYSGWLQDISEEDVKLEGFKTDYKMLPHGIFKKDAIKFFIEDWNSTHKKPEEKWEASPWVFAYEYEVVR